MKRLHLAAALALMFSSALDAPAATTPGSTTRPDPATQTTYNGYQISNAETSSLLIGGSPDVRFKSGAWADTFALYGGPDTLDGKFQDEFGVPDLLGHAPHDIIPGKWFGIDLTDVAIPWQVSTFCAETLDGDGSSGGVGDGPGNLAWWAGQSAEQRPGWATAPGYGSNWDVKLEWRATMADPSVGQTVQLSFAFHHDTEPAYDYFHVEYDSANVAKEVFVADGSNAPFAAPGVQYPADVLAQPIVYHPNRYGGDNDDEIVVSLRVTSDGGYDDEDGKWSTTCGAAIVDDITVTYTDGVVPSLVDFSDIDNTNSWSPGKQPFAGDFSDILPRISDLDPCIENPTPLACFIDYGQCPKNRDNNGGEEPCESTGGSLSTTWSYGVPGGWVVNYTDGLTENLGYHAIALQNEVWSPEIAWDLPGPDDDAPEVAGSFLRFSVWAHLPILNGPLYFWNVRTTTDSGQIWSPWRSRGFAYEAPTPKWDNRQIDITDRVLVDGIPTHVQIALGVRDMASIFAFPGNDATPSPAFDNVGFFKYAIAGPRILANEFEIFMDAFPQSGESDFTTLAGRQSADCRLDIRDLNWNGSSIVPGDSTVVTVIPTLPGSSLNEIKARWILDLNPAFDDARVLPPGATLIAGGAENGWNQWTGEVDAQPTHIPIQLNRYYFDLPDEDFMHPGDVLRYYVWASDDQGGLGTLPINISEFDTGVSATGKRYPSRFTVHGLPSATSDGQGGWTQPSILVLNDFGEILPSVPNLPFPPASHVDEIYRAFAEFGYRRGVEWDMFTTWAPSRGNSNSIGSTGAHGASPEQLRGYSAIVHFTGDLRRLLLSDGTDSGGGDKADDIGVLTSWFNQDADRYVAHFGDNLASGTAASSPNLGAAYLQDILGVAVLNIQPGYQGVSDVREEIGGQTIPVIRPALGSCFTEEYVVNGSCPGLNTFDNLEPDTQAVGSVVSHHFLDIGGSPYGPPGRAASVTWPRLDGNGNRKVSITFPYGFSSIWNKSGSYRGGGNPPETGAAVRSRLMREILNDCFAFVTIPEEPVAAPDLPDFSGLRSVLAAPNPFNPSTEISFELGRRSRVAVKVYTLRGELVATLHDGVLDAGRRSVLWRGLDAQGSPVSSGVYLATVIGDGAEETRKLTLLK